MPADDSPKAKDATAQFAPVTATATTGNITVRETWRDWSPPDAFEPTDEELITREELVKRAQERRPGITERSIRLWEKLGLLPRPIRQWHQGAVRAVYAPWVVGLAEQAYDARRERRPLEEARVHVRDSVEGGRIIPTEFVHQLRTLAEQQAQITGKSIPVAVIHLLDDDGETVATLRHRLDAPLDTE